MLAFLPARSVLRALVLILLAVAAFAAVCLPARPAHAAAVPTLGQKAVAVAAAQAGKPYVFGAAGPRAFDCSGLVKYVYGRLGRSLPHGALAQYRQLRHVPYAQARPGDLVFTAGSGGTDPARIDHVGVYAGGGTWWVGRKAGTTVTRQRIWTSHVWAARPV
jgi:cell wall-associated NlpC family hydrolase